MLQPHQLHAEARHRETPLQHHLDAGAVYRELHELQTHRAIGQRQEVQLMPLEGDAGGVRCTRVDSSKPRRRSSFRMPTRTSPSRASNGFPSSRICTRDQAERAGSPHPQEAVAKREAGFNGVSVNTL
jgi:hypothetical protein